MKNAITVTIPFSFKGKNFEPSARINLDELASSEDVQAFLVQCVASANGIDLYSYEHEMLESTPPIFSEPEGLAVKFENNGEFDLGAFKDKRIEVAVLKTLQEIAEDSMGIDDLSQHPEIKKALLKAYEAGQKARK